MKAKITEATLKRKYREDGKPISTGDYDKDGKPLPLLNEVWDDLLPGFCLRVGKRRSTFTVTTRIDRQQRRFKVGTTATMKLSEARDAARDILRDAAKDVDPKEAEKEAKREATRTRARTFRAVAKEFMAARSGLRSAAELQRKLDIDILPVIGDTAVAKIDRADIRELLRDKAATSPVASNRLLSLIRSILRFAFKEDYVKANVADAIDQLPEVSRDRFLSEPEIKLFWNTLSNGVDLAPATRACLKFLLITGQRRSEAAGAKWSEFDFAKDQWLIPAERTKNGLPHIVPLSDLATDLLDDMADKDSGDYVFRGAIVNQPLSAYTVSQGMKKALPKMKLPGGRATPHDLRRTLITEMNETLGIEPHVVEAIVNHVSGAAKAGVAGIYNKALYLEQRKLALDAWGSLLTEIVTGKAAPSNVHKLRVG